MNNTNITFSFLEKIERANKDFSLFDGAKRILVGLSGGADSTCLLLSLKNLSEKYGFGISALHVNHMIRGEEADRDEKFARKLCEKNGVEFFCERVDVPAISKKSGESLELCARNERYRVFEKICRDNGITHVATAHNACDNSETVLFNLIRGSGTRGLCGIPPKRMLCEGITVIRPLIYCERCEIEEYLSEICQDFVTDSTNSHEDYTRNFIRGEILPLMRRINPSLEESILRSAKLHASDEEYLSDVADENLTDDIEKLRLLHESILSRTVIKAFSRVSDETPSEYHVKTLCEKIYAYETGRTRVSFPDNMSALIARGKLSFVKDERKKSTEEKEAFQREITDGEVVFFEENPYALYITFDQSKDIPQTFENGGNVYKKYTSDYLYFDTIPSVLFARNRQSGDKIRSGGMTKSVKRLMNTSLYHPEERYSVPFLCTGEEILLVPGVAKNDECKKDGNKKEILSVSLYKRQ